tara:strand:+ start:981 stop:1217 length:237 start_codon:yes stop_codon:yes gene_type:complete
LEQLLLLFYIFKYPNYPSMVVGVFAIFVITTISIQKTMLDSKNKEVKLENMKLTMDYHSLLEEYKHVSNLEVKGDDSQ